MGEADHPSERRRGPSAADLTALVAVLVVALWIAGPWGLAVAVAAAELVVLAVRAADATVGRGVHDAGLTERARRLRDREDPAGRLTERARRLRDRDDPAGSTEHPHDATAPDDPAGPVRDPARWRAGPQPLRVVVVDRGVPCALAAGGSRPAIRVDRALVARLDADELDAVLAHELAHIDMRDATIARQATGAALLAAWLVRLTAEPAPDHPWVLLVGVPAALGLGLVALRAATRAWELAADRAAVALTGDPAALARALHSLDDLAAPRPATAAGLAGAASPAFPSPPSAVAPVGAGWAAVIRGLLATHPPTDVRVAALAAHGGLEAGPPSAGAVGLS